VPIRESRSCRLDLLKSRRDEAFDSNFRAGEDVNQSGEACTGKPLGTQVEDQDHEFPTSGTRAGSGHMFRRMGRRWVVAAGVGALGIVVGTAILVVRPWSSSSPLPTCAKYAVTMQGNIVDDAGRDVGNVFPEDLFVVDRSSEHPQLPYRYFGTVENQGISGHVLQKKLNPVGPCT
jgi:hypothetical protein